MSRESLYEQDLTDEQIEQGMKFTEMFSTPIVMSGITLIVNVFFTVVFALIVSIFVKKEQ